MSPQTILFIAIAALSFGGGWLTEHWRAGEQIARIEQQHDAGIARANGDALLRLRVAQARNDALAIALATAEDTLNQTAQEKDHAIRRNTAGRPCLGSAAVGVLNGTKAPAAAAVPQASGEPVPADATFATDTDVGTWIVICQRGYATCNGRLGAIADFYKDSPSE